MYFIRSAAYCFPCDPNSLTALVQTRVSGETLCSLMNLRTRHWRVLDMQCRKIPMCRLFCMVCPELLLYWLFYINKHSQNVADKKPVFWLLSDSSVLAAFSFYERVNMGCSYFFVAESIQQEVNETAFRDFQHIRCLHLEHTCTNAADVVRCRRTRVVRASKQRYVKIKEGGLIHFLLY